MIPSEASGYPGAFFYLQIAIVKNPSKIPDKSCQRMQYVKYPKMQLLCMSAIFHKNYIQQQSIRVIKIGKAPPAAWLTLFSLSVKRIRQKFTEKIFWMLSAAAARISSE